jgi:MFS-type transporter involved in bile tolerance (Atg22 family)
MDWRNVKSWEIALIGAIPGVILLFRLIIEVVTVRGHDIVLWLSGVVLSLISLGLVLLPTLLLKKVDNKKKRIGAILSILFGLMFGGAYAYSDNVFTEIAMLEIIPAFSLFFAGIYYFWKKN